MMCLWWGSAFNLIDFYNMQTSDPIILGVCAWLADRFGLSVRGLRIIWIAALIFGVGSPIIIYLILYLLKPKSY